MPVQCDTDLRSNRRSDEQFIYNFHLQEGWGIKLTGHTLLGIVTITQSGLDIAIRNLALDNVQNL